MASILQPILRPLLSSVVTDTRHALSQGGGFSPSQLFAASEPGFWYDPSDLTSMYQGRTGTTAAAVGSPVGQILDKSGNDNHAVAVSDAGRAILRQSGSLYYLEYDGVDDGYVTPTITPGTDKVQVFAGVRKLGSGGMIAETSAAAGGNNGSAYILAATETYAVRSGGTAFATPTTGATFAAPSTNVLTGLGDISGDRATLRVDGAQVAQSTADQGTGNYLAYPLYIGRRGGTSLPFNGYEYGLIVRFGPNLDAATLAKAEAYMARKTGVTL